MLGSNLGLVSSFLKETLTFEAFYGAKKANFNLIWALKAAVNINEDFGASFISKNCIT